MIKMKLALMMSLLLPVTAYSQSINITNGDFSVANNDPSIGGWTFSGVSGYTVDGSQAGFIKTSQDSIRQATSHSIQAHSSYTVSATSARNYGSVFTFYYIDNGIEVDIASSNILNTTPRSFTFEVPADAIYAGKELGIRISGNDNRSWEQVDNVGLEVVSLDQEPPTPSVMTWKTGPTANGSFSVMMEATTAFDPSGVEYYFTNVSGGGNDSGWQTSPVYVDSIVSPDTTYTYTVKARDTNLNETAPSLALSATTDDSAYPGPVIGYVPTYRPVHSKINFSEVTHLNYAFVKLDASGSGELNDARVNYSDLTALVANAHQNNVEVAISVGGGGANDGFSVMAASPIARANFIANMIQFCNDYGLDGVDMDWEEPHGFTAEMKHNYTTLLQEMHEALSPLGLSLTIAGATWHHEINPEGVKFVNWANAMTYDMGFPDHSSFQDMLDGIEHFETHGWPRNKIVVGLPFYGYADTWASSKTYAWIYDNYLPASDVDLVDGYGFNGLDTIIEKTNYTFANNYGGVMIWEVGQDKLNHPASLLTALSSTAESYRSLMVHNASFEMGTGTGSPDGWILTNGVSGNLGTSAGGTDGAQFLWIGPGTEITQDLNRSLANGDIITLSYDSGRGGVNYPRNIQLLVKEANGYTLLAESTDDTGSGGWETGTLQYSVSEEHAGKQLTIRIKSGGWNQFDNFALSFF